MIPDKYLYISPRQASQTLITHILEAMEKEPERPFYHCPFRRNDPGGIV